MALKTWIDKINHAGQGPVSAQNHNGFAPGKEIENPKYIENRVHAIITLAVMEIEQKLKNTQYLATAELIACENAVNSQAKAILDGAFSEFYALHEACTRWVKTIDEITPETAELYHEVKT